MNQQVINVVPNYVVRRRHAVTRGGRRLRLLCASDLSRRSERAARRAMLLSRELGAELMLFHSIVADGTERMMRRRKVRAHLALEERVRSVAPAGLVPQISVRVGRYRDSIVEVTREWGADLIILGSHRPRLGDGVIGTTAESLMQKTRRPILVVNVDAREPYRHVLLTTDLSNVSAGAARLAQDLGLLEDRLISVIHAHTPGALSMLRMSGVSEPEIESYARQSRRWTSDEIVQQFGQAGLRTGEMSIITQQASPLRAIEHTAQLVSADLVVVGASRFPALKRVLLGSVSNEVLRRIACDVLLVSPAAVATDA